MAENLDAPVAVVGDTSTVAPVVAPVEVPVVKAVPDVKPVPEEIDPDAVVAKETDWAAVRTKFAKGDAKAEKRLARYSSVDSALEALFAAQDKLASGALKSTLPKDATEQQKTEWRAENGIPATAADYDLTLPDGLVIGEQDQPVVANFAKIAHEANMTPDQLQKSVAWYLNYQEQVAEEQAVMDMGVREEGEEVLREAWGQEFKVNKNLIINFLNTAPKGVSALIQGARLADGSMLGSHPDTLRWLADVARTVNPIGTVTSAVGEAGVKAIDAEMADIKILMGDKESAYHKGPKAAGMQARYRELIDAKARYTK